MGTVDDYGRAVRQPAVAVQTTIDSAASTGYNLPHEVCNCDSVAVAATRASGGISHTDICR